MPQPEPDGVHLEEVDDGHLARATETLEKATETLERATPKPPGLWSRTGSFLSSLLKWLLVLAVIAGIAAGVYYGWPVVNDRVIKPIAANTDSVAAVQDEVSANADAIAALETQLADITDAEADLPGRVTSLEDTVNSLDGRVGTLESQVTAHTTRLEALDELQASLSDDAAAASTATIRELGVLRAMELMSRARLYLFQANYGLAEQDVVAARNVIAELTAGEASDSDAELFAEVISRLDRIVEALPARPVAAIADLDIAWQALLGDVAAPAPADNAGSNAAGSDSTASDPDGSADDAAPPATTP